MLQNINVISTITNLFIIQKIQLLLHSLNLIIRLSEITFKDP